MQSDLPRYLDTLYVLGVTDWNATCSAGNFSSNLHLHISYLIELGYWP